MPPDPKKVAEARARNAARQSANNKRVAVEKVLATQGAAMKLTKEQLLVLHKSATDLSLDDTFDREDEDCVIDRIEQLLHIGDYAEQPAEQPAKQAVAAN